MNKVALVTGGSSGIGKALCKKLSENGFTVFELSRNGKTESFVTHLNGDVTDKNSIIKALECIEHDFGRIDLVVANAGFGISGSIEFTDNDDSHNLMEVNLFGAVNTAKAAIPYLRKSKGRIVFTSSVAGIIPIPFQAWYSISKSAINALCLTLRNEVKPFGITVAAVLPGDIQSGFTANRQKSTLGNELYEGRIDSSVAVMENDERNGMSPDNAARFIYRVCVKRKVKPFTVIGAKYKLFSIIAKLLPVSITNHIVGRMYS